MSYEHRRAAVKTILEALPPDEGGLIAALGAFATDAMDEAERSKGRIKHLEERLSAIKDIAGGVGSTRNEATIIIPPERIIGALGALAFNLEGPGTESKPVTFVETAKVEQATKPSTKRSEPCLLALRLLSPDETCRDPDCGFPASAHRNYNGTSK
jgi:hypothetical protein